MDIIYIIAEAFYYNCDTLWGSDNFKRVDKID